MARAFTLRLAFLLASLLPLSLYGLGQSAKSASALAAWALGSNGVLELRTSVDASLQAFYQLPELDKGLRVWIDFPGELIRQRTLSGSGPVREIRLGKPAKGRTRLVIEFNPEVFIDAKKLNLIGISPDRWKLAFVGLSTRGLRSIGEGSLNNVSSINSDYITSYRSINSSLKHASLPEISRGKYTVVIDPGHGGPDVGAVGLSGVRETDIVLDISLQVASLLQSKGVKVILTRKSEVDLDLPPRVAIANRSRADAFVSIHANATRKKSRDVNGIETFYFSGSRGFELSSSIQRNILNVSPGSPDRGVRRGRFFVIRRTNMPAALVETGFLTGSLDAPRLANSSHRRNLSIAIARGIIEYLRGRN